MLTDLELRPTTAVRSTVGWCWGALADRHFFWPFVWLFLAIFLAVFFWALFRTRLLRTRRCDATSGYTVQAWPLTLAAVGAVLAPLKLAPYPKLAELPGAMNEFQPASRAVTVRPDWV
jgi:hypothetical protein